MFIAIVIHFTDSLSLMPIAALPKEGINRLVQTIATISPSFEVVIKSVELLWSHEKSVPIPFMTLSLMILLGCRSSKQTEAEELNHLKAWERALSLVFTLSSHFCFQFQRSSYSYLVRERRSHQRSRKKIKYKQVLILPTLIPSTLRLRFLIFNKELQKRSY